VGERRGVGFSRFERLEGRHADIVVGDGVEGLVATDADLSAGVGEEGIGKRDALLWFRWRHGWTEVFGQSIWSQLKTQ
jgi:hypothetical protein